MNRSRRSPVRVARRPTRSAHRGPGRPATARDHVRGPARRPRARAACEAGQGPVGSEHLEGLEQRGAHPPAGDGHPDRGLGLAQLAAHRLAHGQGGGMEGVAVPLAAARPRRPRWPRPGWCGPRRRRPPPWPRPPRRCPARRGTGSRPWPAPRRGRPPAPGPAGPWRRTPPRRSSPSGQGAPSPVSQGRQASMNSSSGHGPDVLAVHVGELGHVEEGRRVVDVLQAEPLEHLVDGEDLLAARRAPPEQAQVVDEGLGQVALVPVGLDRHRVPPLGQLLALLVDQHGQVGEDRQRRRRPARPRRPMPSVVHPIEASASHTRMPLGVVGSRSSPRITWVMAMSMSSTTLARTNSGAPLALTATKSSMAAQGNSTVAPDDVVDDGDPSSGVRNRRARPSPRGRPRWRQKPS